MSRQILVTCLVLITYEVDEIDEMRLFYLWLIVIGHACIMVALCLDLKFVHCQHKCILSLPAHKSCKLCECKIKFYSHVRCLFVLVLIQCNKVSSTVLVNLLSESRTTRLWRNRMDKMEFYQPNPDKRRDMKSQIYLKKPHKGKIPQIGEKPQLRIQFSKIFQSNYYNN